MKVILSTILELFANILLSQVNSFPYTESFEQSFNVGSNIEFISSWRGNTVATRNRIFSGSNPRTGERSLNIIPTSTFKGTIEVSLDLSNANNPKLSFYAYSKQNGSSSSSRPTLLSISTSLDGGLTYSNDVAIGDDTTFPNNDSTTYSRYTYELPNGSSTNENVIIRLIAERGSGSGSAAELVIDDLSIESQVLPVKVISVEAVSRKSIQLHFNQPILEASAEDIKNYSISNNIGVQEAKFISPNSVLLQTDSLENSTYEISISNIQDSFSKTPSDTLLADFTFIENLEMVEVIVVDKRTIELAFNLVLDSASSEVLTNYGISPQIGPPLGLEKLNSKRVSLSLASDLQDENYNVTVNGVKDQSTLATAQNITASFEYLPLEVIETNVVSPTEIQLRFNQYIQHENAQLLSNYSFNYELEPILISLSDSTANLKLNRPLVNNTYTVTLNNIRNLSGNATTEDLEVEFKYETSTLPRQIVINEIFADPSGDHEPNPISLPNDSNNEFVELYNNSVNAINIGGFQLSGGKIQDFVLLPKSYVILTANSNRDKFSAFSVTLGVSSWNSLTNNGEQIILTDNLGNVVDSLTYDKSWYGDIDKSDGGWSIEQINPSPSCLGSHNWSSSNDPKGATPGQENSIYDLSPDVTPPKVSTYRVINDSTLTLEFNEVMDQSTLTKDNLVFSSGLAVNSIKVVDTKDAEVHIMLESPFEYGYVHTLNLFNITDCPGNKIQPITLEFYRGTSPMPDEIIITEIMVSPAPSQGLPEAEYLELYNRSDKIISLSDLTIADLTSSTKLTEFDLHPNEYILLTPNTARTAFEQFGNVMGVSNWISLNNAGDRLSIYNTKGELITMTNYSDSWYRNVDKSEGGYALEMIDTSFPCLEAQNWIASQNELGGTPGQVNSVNDRNPDLFGPKLIQAIALSPSTIQLNFDEKLNASIIEPSSFMGSLGLSFISAVVNEDDRSVLLTTSEDLMENTIYDITADGITDCSGNLIRNDYKSVQLIIASKAEPQDILINEVLFNPRSGGVRFVEVYNQSNKYINLQGWQISGSSNSKVIAEENLFMSPNDFITLTNNGVILVDHYPNTLPESLVELSSMPSLPSDEGQISLKNSEGIEIDGLFYSEDYHSPLIPDTEGVSIERIRYSEESNSANNWFSASSTEYSATPGYENSQSRSIEVQEQEITVEPLAFAPESTRASNFATISYSFETPGNTLNTKIIDANGNLVKVIGQNVIAGKTGFFTWDGSTDQLGKARVGYYMVLVEIISPNGEVRYLRNKVAIATRF